MARPKGASVLAAGGALALAACGGGEATLEGSISEAFDLSFSSIDLRRNDKAFQVTYLRSNGNETVMRITVVLIGIELRPGEEVSLSGEYDTGHPRCVVSRAVTGEPLRTLPDVDNGNFSVDNEAMPAQNTAGSFFIRFGEGGDVGSGRTVNGVFKGKVVEAP